MKNETASTYNSLINIFDIEFHMKDFLESEGFYNLMQDYRNAPIIHQTYVIEKYEAVKTAILTEATKNHKPGDGAVVLTPKK